MSGPSKGVNLDWKKNPTEILKILSSEYNKAIITL